MAATSPPQSGRQFAQDEEGGKWRHQKNSLSQDSRHNFSYPHAYSQSPLQQSPQSTDGFVTTTIPSEGAASGFNFGDAIPSKPKTIDSRNTSYGEANDTGRQGRMPYSAPGSKKQGSNRLASPEDDKSNWIHRDKLTAIEIQEHIALGREVPPELLRKIENQQRLAARNRANPTTEGGDFSDKRRRIHTPSPEDYEEYDDDLDEPFVPVDPRSPEEIAVDPDAMYHQNTRLHSSSSRIPLSTTSPLPVPQDHLDRTTRLPRKRSVSNAQEQDSIAYPGYRPRSASASIGSGAIEDEIYPPSPSKAKVPKGVPTGRKGSGVRSTSAATRNRTTSGARNSPAGRPVTRDGNRATPPHHAPEGDPPWLATMYKPDPRLPPDQQLLPTHAKRMMQEQWEKEGKPGQIYDRDFRPVAAYPEHSNGLPPPELSQDNAKQGHWPESRENSPERPNLALTPQLSHGSYKNQTSPQRNQGNGEVHGGYSTIPKIQSTPILGSSSPRPDQHETFEVEEQQPKKKKAGCGCCVVM